MLTEWADSSPTAPTASWSVPAAARASWKRPTAARRRRRQDHGAEHRPAVRAVPQPLHHPELSFEFHYFFMRKFWFAYLAKALVVFPGRLRHAGRNDGSADAGADAEAGEEDRHRALRQRVLEGRSINFEALVKYGMISPEDLSLVPVRRRSGDGLRARSGVGQRPLGGHGGVGDVGAGVAGDSLHLAKRAGLDLKSGSGNTIVNERHKIKWNSKKAPRRMARGCVIVKQIPSRRADYRLMDGAGIVQVKCVGLLVLHIFVDRVIRPLRGE
jgi:hypothetical protein